jgi:integrase
MAMASRSEAGPRPNDAPASVAATAKDQEKPSNIETRERLFRVHLKPDLGDLRLDAITDEQVQRLKGRMSKQKPKSVNNVLTNLNKLLKVALEWKVIDAMPCRIRLLKSAKPVVEFYEEPDYERLVEAAEKVDARTHLAVLLGGDAGLRLGEILGLEWSDVDKGRALLKVRQAVYEDEVTLPKGGKPRVIPMTARLRAALAAHQHLRGNRVLYQDDGRPADKWWLKWALDVAERRAGLRRGGRVHILRHTFCSRLAARNVPMLTIKELAGHQSLETTMRYMHLSSAAPREGIKASEAGVEAGAGEGEKLKEINQ